MRNTDMKRTTVGIVLSLCTLITAFTPVKIAAEETAEPVGEEEVLTEETSVPETEIIMEESPAPEEASPSPEAEIVYEESTAEPAETPEASLEPEPTEVPTPDITEEPEPTEVPMPEITEEPEPTEIPMPEITEEPEPSMTPEPTEEPQPSASPTPTPEAVPVSVYRMYNRKTGDHFYTVSKDEKNSLSGTGWLDEGIGWIAPSWSLTPVYRVYNEKSGEHLYTMDTEEKDRLASVPGWKDEGICWYSDDAKTVPMMREYNPRQTKCNHNYTADPAEHEALIRQGWIDEGIAWYALEKGKPAPKPTPTPAVRPLSVYRVYNAKTGEHFYTLSEKEKNALVKLGWAYEGIGWVAPSWSDTPVYRIYNKASGDHHYTTEKKEKDTLVKENGWIDEGVGWYSDDRETVALMREYNPRRTKCNHNFTTDRKEHETLVKRGWVDEGIAWYALEKGKPAPKPTPAPTAKAESKTYSYTVPYYAQRDSRWANKKYGKYYFGNTGCGVTSIAMCISAVTGKSITPNIVADYLYSIGSFSTPNHHGTTGMSRYHAAKHWGVKCELLKSMAAMQKALEEGKVISMAVRGQSEFMANKGSHGLTLHQYKDGKTYVYDPWNKNKNGWYSLQYLWNLRSHVPADLDAGPEIIFSFWND